MGRYDEALKLYHELVVRWPSGFSKNRVSFGSS